ncbi:MAG: CPBP family intramembrane glutamic endopeptidase [Pseudomonadota bacterium]
MARVRDRYGPNRRLTAYLRDPGAPTLVIFGALAAYLGWSLLRQAFISALPPETGWGETRMGFFLNGGFFAVLISFTALTAQRLHGIDPRRFLGDRRVLWADMKTVTLWIGGFYLAVYAVYAVVFDSFAGAEVRSVPAWLAFLPFACGAIAMQTLAEEVFFRGYLHHFASRFFRNPLGWLLVPSLAFGVAHVFNDTASFGTILAYIGYVTCFGVAAADLTARTGSLGAAWGLHFASNAFIFCVSTEEGGYMSGAALYVFQPLLQDYVPDGAALAMSFAYNLMFLLVMWLLARNALRL